MLPSRCSQPPCRNWLVTSVAVSLRQVVAAAPRRRSGRPGRRPMRDERLERRLAAAGEQPELPGEDDEAGDDDAERDDRRPPRRIGVPQRDHGGRPVRASWSVSGSPSAGLGARARRRAGARAGRRRTSGTATRTAWWMPVARHPDERRRARPRRPAMTYIAAQVRPVGAPPASRYWRLVVAVRPCRARRSGRSACRRRRSSPGRVGPARRRRASRSAPAGAACPSGAFASQPSSLPADEPDERRRRRRRTCRRRRTSRSSPTTSRAVASQAVGLGREAAAVGGRRVGPDLLLGRVDDVQVVEAARPGSAGTCPMPMTSSPSEAAPSSGDLGRACPCRSSSAGRQRHRTFLESRISRSWPPTAR